MSLRLSFRTLLVKPLTALLADIGKPMIQWVYEQALQAGAEDVIIATDDERVSAAAEQFGGKVCMTSPNHESGTERLAEVVEKMVIPADHIEARSG